MGNSWERRKRIAVGFLSFWQTKENRALDWAIKGETEAEKEGGELFIFGYLSKNEGRRESVALRRG